MYRTIVLLTSIFLLILCSCSSDSDLIQDETSAHTEIALPINCELTVIEAKEMVRFEYE